MIALLSLIKKSFKLVSGSKIIFKLVRHYAVLNESLTCINTVMTNLSNDNRTLPTHAEGHALLIAISNILKTGLIDVPGIDEYDLALKFDYVSEQFALGIADSKSGKYHTLPVLKKVKKKKVVAEILEPESDEGDSDE